MKTKREIIKWLEEKRAEALQIAATKRVSIEDAFFAKRNKEIHLDETAAAIYGKLQEAVGICEKWIAETAQREGMYQVDGYYGNMLSMINKGTSEIRSAMMLHFQENSSELNDLRREHEKIRQKIKTNYNNVIANVNSAKNNRVAIDYLRELGFDVSSLEESAESSTELSVPVDTSYLIVGRKDGDKCE